MATLCVNNELSSKPNNTEGTEFLITQLRNHIENRKCELEESFKIVFERLENKKKDLLTSLDSILINTEEELRELHKQPYITRHTTNTESEIAKNSENEDLQASIASVEVSGTGQNEVDIPFITLNKESLELDFFVENYLQLQVAPNPYVYKKQPIWESSREKKLNSLQGIAVCDFSGEIYVADSGNKCVQVFNKNGELRRKIKDLKMSSPQYICVSEKFLYTSCWDNRTILKLDNKKGIRMQYNNYPQIITGLAVDKDENLYGCVWKENTIVVWDKELIVKEEIKLDNLFISGDTEIRDLCYFNKEFYVLFKDSIFSVQIFNKKGGLVRCPIKEGEVAMSKRISTLNKS
ncbi:hypothetical protein LOD99_4997 [Oopsacas minuta]|uniref:Uncharacterized protein n=1 Tax=Oopsacas minuta TaxID=111878 RepID=A0AAV7JSA6_9METZ|nr:hypothetical protein LOD99_4997 [Oopsacas minuta]